MKTPDRIAKALDAHRQTLGSILAVVLIANVVTVAGRTLPGDEDGRSLADGSKTPTTETLPSSTARAGARTTRTGGPFASPTSVATAKPGTYIPGKGTVPFGLSGNKIKVVYYWNDRTTRSQFLHGTGQEGNVDESLAFKTLVAWINKHADGGELMGYKFDLHGWRIDPVVKHTGKGDDLTRAVEDIATNIKPMVAISSHGSASSYACPRLAQARIFNVSTYDLTWDLAGRSNGYCLPQGLAWDKQVDVATGYLAKHSRTTTYGALSEPRRYGLLYAEYPDLVRSIPRLEQTLKSAGVNIVAQASVDSDLTAAQKQRADAVAKFVDADVNTVIAPDSGSLIGFTHAAQAAGYSPDYFVWPCSGADSTGMVRLYNAAQWRNAYGLSCYDPHFNADLTNDDLSRRTEWYKAYREIDDSHEPPAPTSLVYQSLLPLVAGITYAGKDLTIERFSAGLTAFRPYRYDMIDGRTTDDRFIKLTLNAPHRSQVGDVAIVRWDPSTTSPGNKTPGTYIYSDRRYARRADF